MMWVGATGEMSRNAYTRASSYTLVEGMAPDTILSGWRWMGWGEVDDVWGWGGVDDVGRFVL